MQTPKRRRSSWTEGFTAEESPQTFRLNRLQSAWTKIANTSTRICVKISYCQALLEVYSIISKYSITYTEKHAGLSTAMLLFVRRL